MQKPHKPFFLAINVANTDHIHGLTIRDYSNTLIYHTGYWKQAWYTDTILYPLLAIILQLYYLLPREWYKGR